MEALVYKTQFVMFFFEKSIIVFFQPREQSGFREYFPQKTVQY